MKKVILLVLLMPFMAHGQIVENFESGNILHWSESNTGRWKADTTASLSGKYSLHHIFDNPASGTDRIGIPTSTLKPAKSVTRWSFLVRYGYEPSSSNNWSVFLMSDKKPAISYPDEATNGFALGVNLTGYDDTLRLWKVKGSTVSAVVTSRINWQTDIETAEVVKIVVERTSEGDWTVSVFRTDGGLAGSDSGFDSELFSPDWLVLLYRYTSTRDQLLWFDDLTIEGDFSVDKEAPFITKCEAAGKNIVDIVLNEELATDLTATGNILLNAGENRIVSVVKLTALSYRIVLTDILINRSLNYLFVSELCDRSGNCARNIQIPFTPFWADRGDVIISEIMADPLPEVSLPGKEYLEITNRTNYTINLKNWKLATEGQSILFPETRLLPSGIMIICLLQDTSLFAKFGRVAGLKQFTSLTDEGRLIWLSDSSGTLIHGVEYSSEWYGDELKSEGGWSLEMTDTMFPFFYEGNWTASGSRKGGTPGYSNSVSQSNPDISFYGIQNVFPADSTKITIRLSEPVFDLPGLIENIKIEGNEIADIYPVDPLFRKFSVTLKNPLTRRESYLLEIRGEVKDFAGNSMQRRNFDFGLPETAVSGDILFNELLFNPLPGDPDYIEFYNSSEKIIDASRLQLIAVDDATGDTTQISTVSDEERCIMPASYDAITVDSKSIAQRYFSGDPEHLFETESLPSMSDDKGHVILYNRELDVIDQVNYKEEMHYSLLSAFEGVALEKTAPRNKSGEVVNWHSASESSGWGTPGALNSLYLEFPLTSDKVTFSSSRITPDNDGNEDVLIINLNLTGNGNVISVTVFDETGSFIKKIATNYLAGPEASLMWDGTAEDGSAVKTGIYIVYITLFDDKGKTDKWKKVCTVVR